MDIKKHKLDLNQEDNKIYFGLLEEHNILVKKIQFINEKILLLKHPKIFLLCNKYRIKSLVESLNKLQIMVDTWSANYTNFIRKPSLTFSGDEERELGFIHFMRLIEIMDSRVNKIFDTSIANIIKVQERHSNQVNFIIAILSATISLIGLIIAIYTIKSS